MATGSLVLDVCVVQCWTCVTDSRLAATRAMDSYIIALIQESMHEPSISLKRVVRSVNACQLQQ